MKAVSVILMFVLSMPVVKAQTWNEWFKQKKTQIQYLVNQIGALQVYIEVAQKGYKIVDEGLTVIGSIKNGDFNLHRDFITALQAVNPKLRSSASVAGIIALEIEIVQSQKKSWDNTKTSTELSYAEIGYIKSVYDRLLQQAEDNADELVTLITAGQYELSDDQRMKRINLLYADMREKYQFVHWFADQTNVLVQNRKKEKQDAEIGRSLMIDKK